MPRQLHRICGTQPEPAACLCGSFEYVDGALCAHALDFKRGGVEHFFGRMPKTGLIGHPWQTRTMIGVDS